MDQVAARSGDRTKARFTGGSPRWGAALRVTAVLLLWTGIYGQEQVGTSRQPSEYAVKAAFLLNFTKFIEWPSDGQAADSPFAICVLGENPFGEVLDEIVAGEKVNGRAIVVREVSELPAGSCAILFISKTEREVRRILSEVPHAVLTVGETDNFLRQGGMIALALENRRVRFDVDLQAAAAGGLRISSRLLNVARKVENPIHP